MRAEVREKLEEQLRLADRLDAESGPAWLAETANLLGKINSRRKVEFRQLYQDFRFGSIGAYTEIAWRQIKQMIADAISDLGEDAIAEEDEAVSEIRPSPGELDGLGLRLGSSAEILALLAEFPECARYLRTRRTEPTLSLVSEAAVQDLVFVMLRPFIHDLVPESPTERVASRYTIKDFRSRTARTIVEAKYIRDRDHGRAVTKELHDDIETYRSDVDCDFLIFLIYDPNSYVPDRGALQRQIEVERKYGERTLTCKLLLVS